MLDLSRMKVIKYNTVEELKGIILDIYQESICPSTDKDDVPMLNALIDSLMESYNLMVGKV